MTFNRFRPAIILGLGGLFMWGMALFWFLIENYLESTRQVTCSEGFLWRECASHTINDGLLAFAAPAFSTSILIGFVFVIVGFILFAVRS